MRLRRVWASALSFGIANAFQNTSPFFLFSTSKLHDTALDQNTHIALARSIHNDLPHALSKCPSDSYIIVSQPGVSSADFSTDRPAHHLSRRMRGEDKDVFESIAIPEVAGVVGLDGLVHFLERECRAIRQEEHLDAAGGWIQIDPNIPRIVLIDFPSPPPSGEERRDKLREHDAFLNEVISGLEGQYTVIYTTSPPSSKHPIQPEHPAPVYEMDAPFVSALHTDLRRDMSSQAGNSSNGTMNRSAPLFEKYQFLSSGIFMGLLVSLLLLSILYVGVNAVAGLEVSYAAFAKETGPQSQKKQ